MLRAEIFKGDDAHRKARGLQALAQDDIGEYVALGTKRQYRQMGHRISATLTRFLLIPASSVLTLSRSFTGCRCGTRATAGFSRLFGLFVARLSVDVYRHTSLHRRSSHAVSARRNICHQYACHLLLIPPRQYSTAMYTLIAAVSR